MVSDDKVRVDKWLWAARFYKTRSLAADAVSTGKVHMNGGRIKPARVVAVGDSLEIRRGEERYTIVVLVLSGRRGPATTAQALYEETAESVEARTLGSEQRRLVNQAAPHPDKRPDKKSRRDIMAFQERNRGFDVD